MGFLENLGFLKISGGGRFAVECVSNDTISLKCLSTLLVTFLRG